MAVSTTKLPARGTRSGSTTASGIAPGGSRKNSQGQLTDDEILGLVTAVSRPATIDAAGDASTDDASGNAGTVTDGTSAQSGSSAAGDSNDGGAESADTVHSSAGDAMPPELAKLAEANPQLRQVLDDAQAYRAVFASPEMARDARSQLDELDGMFFSAQPSDHAALAARIHELSPDAFHTFARAVQAHAAKVRSTEQPTPAAAASASDSASPVRPVQGELFPLHESDSENATRQPGTSSGARPFETQGSVAQATSAQPAATTASDSRRAAQVAFFHDTNAAAVEQILGAIQAQVNGLLPDSVPAGTRNRIVGEVYRELDSTLRANRQLGKQLREAFQAGAGDSAHQRAIVTLVAGRAKQALPSVAKRVIGEWTQSIVAANRERLSRHETASKRVDIAGAGASDGVNRKSISARDLNYKRLSDADILNL